MDGEGAELDNDVVVLRDDEVGDGEKADSTGVGVDGDDEGNEPNNGKPNSVRTCCALGRIVKINRVLTNEQRAAVRESGFGSLIGMSQAKILRKLCRRLVESYDVVENAIKIDGREIAVSPSCVARVMGFREGELEVKLSGSVDAIAQYQKKLAMYERGISVTFLADKLEKCWSASANFKVMYMLLVMETVLAPKSSVYIPTSYLHVAVDIANVSKRNWVKWSFDYLVKGVMKFKSNQKHKVVAGNMVIRLLAL